MPNIQTAHVTPLQDLQPLYLEDGPSLPLDEQLRRREQPQTFRFVPNLHLDLCRLRARTFRLELLLLFY